ncbi:DUF2235 domain-containing protein [Flavobacterium gelidilacus]|uniref:phospholipase effector Tle1 domain-containing protein n=1 Tax=Flavobacterium gelidilacus TaxID=206041 RepID=UPI00041429E7|nr:DUF2235 domain-containing protein [Flavobacterium gelidilacus]
MGQTYVYNSGKYEVSDDEIEVTFGVFIDGTLNNKENTKLKYKVKGEQDPLLEKGEVQKPATTEEKKTYHEAVDTNAIADWFKRQADIGGYGDNSSYANDYTNVARLWFCTKKAYKIYIEGMGTDDFKEDVSDGYAFGSGLTGIRAKVRKGCEKLADEIVKKITLDTTKKLTKITVDVFGFSRGAASARNMVYEIRKSAYAPSTKSIPDGYYPPNPYDESAIPKFKKAQVDKDGLEFDSSLLIDGKLPKYGFLGYCLLKKITPEELEEISIVVRVLGIYDTVSSYYEAGDSLGTYNQNGKVVDENILWKGVKKTAKGLNPLKDANPFSNNENELNLHDLDLDSDLGAVIKAVHFTASDEHRVNFSLTRMKIGIEKNFPGVHCDIGGAYPTGYEEKIKLAEQSLITNLYKGVIGVTKLELFKNQLIKEHWFKDHQIWTSSTLTKIVLKSNRFLKKEYSYIPLQFMEDYCRQTSMNNYFTDKTEEKFSIDGDDILIEAKKHLRPYVMNEGGKEWKFISDEELEERREQREKEDRLKNELNRKIEKASKNKFSEIQEFTVDNLQAKDYITILKSDDKKPFEAENKLDTPANEIAGEIALPEVVLIGYNDQQTLRTLRNEYLHWSAENAGVGLEGRSDRKREEFPKNR